MATTTCKTVAGIASAAQPYKVRAFSAATVAGVYSLAGNVAWGGSQIRRKAISWLPPATTPLSLDGGKTMNPVWFRALHELFENRLGGIDAPTVPEVVTTAKQTQTQVLTVQKGVQSVGSQVTAITNAVNTQTQVAKESSLAGSDQLQTLPSYKLDQLGQLE